MANTMSIVLVLLFISSSYKAMAASFNILDLGAKADGQTDSAEALLGAWAAACASHNAATIVVPSGKFYVSQALFKGPCNNTAIRISIQGTIVAASSYSGVQQWLTFQYVEGVSIYGGTLDGQGQSLWSCKLARVGGCPDGATSLAFDDSKDVLVSGLTLVNSKMFHMVIFGSSGVTVQGAKITAPANSPNTDGIHVQMSSGVTITGSNIKTGDDCISMGQGTTDVWIERVSCGPGHGISIGSLGSSPGEAGVNNVTVKNVVFKGTQNGLRIKTWGKPNAGYVTGVTFDHAIMQDVQNPIIIEQNYCPGNVNCPGQNSGVKISDVTYNNIQGTSATEVAVTFDCSLSNPCHSVGLQDVKLLYQNRPAQSHCKNVVGSTSGVVVPPSCLSDSKAAWRWTRS